MPRMTNEQALEILNTRPLYNRDFQDAKNVLTLAFERAHQEEVRKPFVWANRWETLPEAVRELDYLDWSLHRVPGLMKKVRACSANDSCITAMVLLLNDWEPVAATVAAAKKDAIKGRKPSTTPRKTKERTLENTGTCPVCGRNIKLRYDSRMVDHGYTLRYGFRNGKCAGVGKLPWEVSPQGRIDFISGLFAYRAGVASAVPEDDKARRNRDRLIEWVTADIAMHQKMVDEWKPAQLPGAK